MTNFNFVPTKAPKIQFSCTPEQRAAINSYFEDLALDDYYVHPEIRDIDDEDW